MRHIQGTEYPAGLRITTVMFSFFALHPIQRIWFDRWGWVVATYTGCTAFALFLIRITQVVTEDKSGFLGCLVWTTQKVYGLRRTLIDKIDRLIWGTKSLGEGRGKLPKSRLGEAFLEDRAPPRDKASWSQRDVQGHHTWKGFQRNSHSSGWRRAYDTSVFSHGETD